MDRIRQAILSDAPAEEFASITIPESYRAVTVHKDEADMFAGLPFGEKDPRQSLHLDDVPVPPLAPGDAIAVRQLGSKSAAWFDVVGRSSGARGDAGVWQFSQESSLVGETFPAGDILLGSNLSGMPNWWYQRGLGRWQVRQGTTLHLKLPALATSLGAMFGAIERAKAPLRIASYAVSQVTLEMVFNAFAAGEANPETDRAHGLVAASEAAPRTPVLARLEGGAAAGAAAAAPGAAGAAV
jgi:hypothetical protein